jgi:hypothetical protein
MSEEIKPTTTQSEAVGQQQACSALAWLCAVCFIGPRSPITKAAAKNDTTCAFCPRCGEPRKFIFTDAGKRVVTKRLAKRKPVKMTSNRVAEKSLDATAQSKGVAIKKKDFGHKANRAVMLRVNQFSENFVRPWSVGLD